VSYAIGQRVDVVHRGTVVAHGVISRFADDSDEYQVNVEQFMTIDFGSVGALAFRRRWADGYDGWFGRSKTAQRWGYVRIEPKAAVTREAGR